MEDMSTRSGNKLTEEQIEQLIKRLRGVEHIEPIVTIEDSNVNNEKMATFAEVVNNQSSNKNNTDESDSKHGEQNKDYASGDSVKPLFFISNIFRFVCIVFITALIVNYLGERRHFFIVYI
jgi:type III secretory pathway lipoprotein EscJ